MPGEPQDVRVNAINSTALHVAWKDPLEKDRNGIIMGYHIHVQETKEEVCHPHTSKFSIFHQFSFSSFFNFLGSQFSQRTDEIRNNKYFRIQCNWIATRFKVFRSSGRIDSER